MSNMEQFKKDITVWYARLEKRGKIFLAVSVLGFVWIIFQLVWNIITKSPPLGGWVAVILNILAISMVGLVVAQFILMRNMQRNFEQNLRESLTKGRRGGNQAEQIMGRRNRGSMRQRGGQMQQALSMINEINPDDLDKQYRPKMFAKPTLVEKWQEIEDAGLYALAEKPKEKIEIIEASEIGGGFFVAKYDTKGIVKERHFMTHRKTGNPLRFSTLRNAKKVLSGSNKNKPSNTRRKPKKKKKR